MTWESIAAKKRQALKDSIPADWVIPAALLPPVDQLDITTFPRDSGFFTGRELEITSTSAQTILSHISSGSWTSEEVTKAFCKAAAVAQQLVCPPSVFRVHTNDVRPTACRKSCSTEQSPRQKN